MGMSGHASGAAVVGSTVALVALAAAVVLARLATRVFLVRAAGLDDAFIAAALLCSVATTVTMCLQVHWGMSRHLATLTLHESLESLKPFYASVVVYNLAMGCTKYSLLLQYLRIFPHKAFRRAVFVMLGVNTVYVLWTTGSAVCACWPVSYFWTQVREPEGGRCLDRFAVWFANAGMNIATDIAIGVLPLPVLKQLHLPKRQRIALMIVFGLGGFTCILSILRLSALYTISRATDLTWENPLAAIWSCAEVNTGILCSCAPTLKAPLARLFPRLFGSTRGGDSGHGNAGDEACPPYNPRPRRQEGWKRRSVGRGKLSFDALGRGLSGRGKAVQCSTISGKSGESEVEMKDFGTQTGGASGEWERQIQVVTTVEQDVEQLGERGREDEKDAEGEGKGSEKGSWGEERA